MSKANRWFGPIGGILFVVAVVLAVGMFADVDAEPSDSASTVLGQFRANADNIYTAALVLVLGLGFLLIFVGHIRTRMRDSGAGWAADGFLGGGVAVAALLPLSAAVLRSVTTSRASDARCARPISVVRADPPA